jgi:hypothetical protein
MLPSQYLSLDKEEKAFVIASIQIKLENDKKKQKELESKAKRK